MADDTRTASEPEIAIFTAMRVETDSLSELLTDGKESNYWSDHKRNLHIMLKSPGGAHHLILPRRAYAQNETAAAGTKLLSMYPSIRKLIFLGVGGGVPPAKRGDIVISNEVANISLKKLLPGGKTRAKPLPSPASKELVDQAEDVRDRMAREPTWWERTRRDAYGVLDYQPDDVIIRQIASGNINEQPEPWVGLIASSNDNINDERVREKWKKDFKAMGRKLYAFEMEGSALAEVAWANDRQLLIVRGVSDLSDGKGRKLDTPLQDYAAKNAAIFLAELLKSLPAEVEDKGRIFTGEFKMYELGCTIASPENSMRQLLLVQRTSSLVLGPEPLTGSPYYWDKKFSKACLDRIKDARKNLAFRFHYFYSGEKTALKLVDFLNDARKPVHKKRSVLQGVIQNIKRCKEIESITSSDEGPRFRFDSITSSSGPFAVGDREVAVWLAERGSGNEKESLVVSSKSESLAKRIFERYSEFVKPNPSRAEDLLRELSEHLKDPRRGLKKDIVESLRTELSMLKED